MHNRTRQCDEWRLLANMSFQNKTPLSVLDKGVKKKGDDILSHKLQYHLRRRA